MPFLKLLICLFAGLVITGCTPSLFLKTGQFPAPSKNGDFCCWQSTQQLDIQYDGQGIRLTAIIALTAEGAHMALLDPLGRRLLSVKESDGELELYKFPELPDVLPPQRLLRLIQLAWWPEASWQHLIDTDWLLSLESTSRHLSKNNQPILSITDFTSAVNPTLSTIGSSLLLTHHREPLTLQMTTRHWQAL